MRQPDYFPYQTLIEQNLCGIYRTRPGGHIIFCNHAFAAMLGYVSAAELIGTDAEILYVDRDSRPLFIAELLQKSKLVNYQVTLRRKDGSIFYGLENVCLFTDPGGESYLDGVMIDISEQKKASTALAESERKYRQIVETAQEGIWVLDVNDKTTFVNPKMCAILGYSPEEMLGKELYDFMDKEGKAYAMACMERRRKGAKENLDIRYVSKDGQDVWCNISTAPICDTEGTYEGALAMVTDITAKKQAEAEKEQLIASLSGQNEGLRQFTYIVSHNLRAPVANILGLVTLLKQQDKQLPGKLLAGIESSAGALNKVIHDLHDILRIRGGGFEQKENVSLKDLVESIIDSINLFIKDNHARFVMDFSEAGEIYSVRSYLHSIFYNLMVNAIKYARPGVPPVITISSFRAATTVGLRFEDNGKGIDLQRAGRDLFGLYKRFDTSVEGRGMGLFMVKAQVESLGGTIDVESSEGAGSVFTVLLPLPAEG